MAEQYANAATTTLSADITTTGQTSLSVASATGFPATGTYRIVVDNEIMTVTAGAGTTTWTVTRQSEDSTRFPATTHLSGATIFQDITAGSILALPGRFFMTGLDAAKLAPGTANGGEAGVKFYATDTNVLYVSDGAVWNKVSGNPPRCRIYHSAAQTITNSTNTNLNFDSERYDTDNQHYTSSATATGTGAMNNSTTLTGTSTLFTSELSVGQVIDVFGQVRVITAIASNTSLTVNTAFTGGSLTGKTITRVNSAIVARTPGTYLLTGHVTWASNATGIRLHGHLLNGTTQIGSQESGTSTGFYWTSWPTVYQLAQWDYVQIFVQQGSGGNLDTRSDPSNGCEATATWLGYP